MILCEYMSNQLAPEVGDLNMVGVYDMEIFTENVFKRHLPSLPPGGKEHASDLMKYCIISGLLFRGWILYTKGRTKYPAMAEIIENAVRRREQRISDLKSDAQNEVKDVVNREARFLKAFLLKIMRT